MTKNKLAKIVAIVLAGATTVALGLTAGCKKGKTHNWDWDYSTTGHWQYCTDDGCDEKTQAEPHKDAVGDGKCDDCGATMHTHSYTKWVSTDANQHWKVCEADGEIDETTRANHDFSNGNCECGKEAPTAGHTHSYTEWGSDDTQHWKYCEADNVIDEATKVNHDFTNGNCECGKANPNGSTPPVETTGKNEYTVYLYAPEANGAAVTVTVWSPEANPDGLSHEFTDGSAMTAVPDKTGWYSFTFKTDKEIAAGANFNYYVGDVQEATTTGYTTDANWVYFISNKADIKFNSMAAAEAAYNAIANPGGEDEDTETTTVYFHKPADWEGTWIGAHAYYGAADTVVTGRWGTTKMTADADEWYKVDIELPEGTANFNIIIFDENDVTGAEIRKSAVVTAGADAYINAKGNVFTSKTAAETDEAGQVPEGMKAFTVHIHVNKSKLTNNDKVTIYAWGTSNDLFGAFNATEMTAEGNDWYVVSVNVLESLTGGEYHVIIADGGEGDGHQYDSAVISIDDSGRYINTKGNIFATKAEAEADEAAVVTTVSVTIHIQQRSGWGETITAYFYYNGATIPDLNGWPGNTVQKDSENDGWYVITVDIIKAAYDNGYNVMPEQGNDTPISGGLSEVWLDASGNVTATKPN